MFIGGLNWETTDRKWPYVLYHEIHEFLLEANHNPCQSHLRITSPSLAKFMNALL